MKFTINLPPVSSYKNAGYKFSSIIDSCGYASVNDFDI